MRALLTAAGAVGLMLLGLTLGLSFLFTAAGIETWEQVGPPVWSVERW